MEGRRCAGAGARAGATKRTAAVEAECTLTGMLGAALHEDKLFSLAADGLRTAEA